MNNEDGWDWDWLFFVGIFVFRLTQEDFWKLTPRQLHVLSKEHSRYNDTGDDKKKKKQDREYTTWDKVFGG